MRRPMNIDRTGNTADSRGPLLAAVAMVLLPCAAPGFAAEGQSCLRELGSEARVDGASFVMGDDTHGHPEELPVHEVTVSGFWIDRHEVTNSQYAEFVAATGYVTVAERPPDPEEWPGVPAEALVPGSAVFSPPAAGQFPANWWSYVPGASWRHPAGPGSSVEGREHFPVVHIAWEDAKAYADWIGRELPTEAQFELAARSKRAGVWPWEGGELAPVGHHRANTWQGNFPVENTGEDGHLGLAPVGCFEENAYGTFDLIGNVWEWTSNWYTPGHIPTDEPDPTGPPREISFDHDQGDAPVKVIKGGSFLCAPNYCQRYRPAVRQSADTGLGTSHIGFRTVRNE